MPESFKLVSNHCLVKGIQVCSSENHVPLKREIKINSLCLFHGYFILFHMKQDVNTVSIIKIFAKACLLLGTTNQVSYVAHEHNVF